MSPEFVLILFIGLLVLGIPVAYVMFFVSMLFVFTTGVDPSLFVQKMGNAYSSVTLISVPTFIVAGAMMNNVGLTNALFGSINSTPIGKLKGGLAHVNILSSLVFAGMSGAALADIGGLGRIEIKAMQESGYSKEDAAGITLGSSAIGPIFPPSIPIMLYALYAKVSGVKMLVAGIVPALLVTALMMMVVAWRAHKHNWPVSDFKGTLWERAKAILKGLPAFCCPAFLLIGMYSGNFAPSELACVSCVLAILIGWIFYRGVDLKTLWKTGKETVNDISAMLFITGSAVLFAYTITVLQVPDMIQSALLGISTNPIIVLLMVNVTLLIIGMFIDCNIAIMILVPLLLPTLTAIGVDPVHLGIVVVMNVVIGIYTPPFGVGLFLGSIITEIPYLKLVRAVVPYYIPLFITLLLVTFVPALSTWLPNLIYGG